MEILADYSQSNSNFAFSRFAQDCKNDVISHSLTLEIEEGDWEKLKNTWSEIINNFKSTNKDIKITADLFRVEWDVLLRMRKLAKSIKDAKNALTEELVEHGNSLANMFQNEESSLETLFNQESEPRLGSLFYKTKIEQTKSKLKYVAKLHEQDMLFFNVLDFSQKKKTSSLRSCLTPEEYQAFKKEFQTRFHLNTLRGNYCKEFLVSKGLRSHAIRKEKKKLKKEFKKDPSLVETRGKLWVLKICKLYLNCSMLDYANEDVYLYFVLAPIFKSMAKLNNKVYFLFGETNLKAKANEVNRHLYDDERRCAGPKIDAIVVDKEYKFEIAIIEVSGPPNKVNQTHFLEDRNKICKNLKSMHKHIVSKMEVPNITLIKKIKLFGIHVYDNKVHVYSLSKPCDHCYVFSEDICFPIPNSQDILAHSIPTFIKHICVFEELINITCTSLDDLFTVDPNQEILSESNDEPSPYASPHKKQKLNPSPSNQ